MLHFVVAAGIEEVEEPDEFAAELLLAIGGFYGASSGASGGDLECSSEGGGGDGVSGGAQAGCSNIGLQRPGYQLLPKVSWWYRASRVGQYCIVEVVVPTIYKSNTPLTSLLKGVCTCGFMYMHAIIPTANPTIDVLPPSPPSSTYHHHTANIHHCTGDGGASCCCTRPACTSSPAPTLHQC